MDRNAERSWAVPHFVDLAELRRRKDDHFARSPDSPLTDGQRRSFTGLHYYDEDPRLRLEVVLDRPPVAEYDEIQTSDGRVRVMPRAGTLRFTVDGEPASVVAYDQGEELFIPFRDATSGTETYGAGRYVEAHALGAGRYLLDFNLAYNPYCAYNDAWSCPLPPRENWLSVPIRAGEKAFH